VAAVERDLDPGLSKGLASVVYEVSATEPAIWFGVAGIIGATTGA